jgi:hypothetical protein
MEYVRRQSSSFTLELHMNSKARITSDFPTPGEVALQLHIPADRVAELNRQLVDLQITHPDGSITVIQVKNLARGVGSGGRNGKKVSTDRVAKAAAKKK